MGHCCKHVINGTCKEKESFKKVASINNIPSCVTDEVLEKYIDLSKSVLDSSTAVGLSGFGKKITLCLEGTREYCDYVDYIATEEDNNKIRAGIVSTFVKETHYELYWLLQCLYDKYKMNRDMIVGFDMLPVITESSEEYNGKYSHKLKLEMPYAEKALRRGGYYYIDRREEIKDYSIGCLFDYHITKGIEKAESDFGFYNVVVFIC